MLNSVCLHHTRHVGRKKRKGWFHPHADNRILSCSQYCHIHEIDRISMIDQNENPLLTTQEKPRSQNGISGLQLIDILQCTTTHTHKKKKGSWTRTRRHTFCLTVSFTLNHNIQLIDILQCTTRQTHKKKEVPNQNSTGYLDWSSDDFGILWHKFRIVISGDAVGQTLS
jgi:hypothetical protein